MLFALSCSQEPRFNGEGVSAQDEFFMDDEDDDPAYDDFEGAGDIFLTEGVSVPAGIKLATSLQAGLNWSRCESIENSGSRYARLFGIVRTECSNYVAGIVSQEIRVYYTVDGTNWLRVNARYIGYSNNKRFKRFYFATGEIAYDAVTSKTSPVVRFKISYVRNGVELWVNGFKDFCTTPDPAKAPLANDGSRYTQSIPGIFHIVGENLIAFPVYGSNNIITGYKVRTHCLSKYVPAYQLKNGVNTKRVSFHCLTWPVNWAPTIGKYATFTGGWSWGNAFRSDLTNRAYNVDASLSRYFAGFFTNLGVVDPGTLKRYYYKHYTNGYENLCFEYTFPADTRGIQFIYWSESWNQQGTRYQFFDKHRCRRYWIAMPVNGGTNVLKFHYNYNFSEYLKASSAVVTAIIPK